MKLSCTITGWKSALVSAVEESRRMLVTPCLRPHREGNDMQQVIVHEKFCGQVTVIPANDNKCNDCSTDTL